MSQRYFDAAASTPLDPLVRAEMQKYFEIFGNENSKHYRGFEAKKIIEKSLQTISDCLGTSSNHLSICYSGTDANRRFVWSGIKRFGAENVFGSAVEHSSVKDEILPQNYFDPLGDFSDIKPDAKVISLMAANSEVGTIFSAEKLRQKFPRALIHRDYVQAIAKKSIEYDHADAITFAAHKFYGPKMIGLIWIKNPQLFPEFSKDSHTKNVWLIAGMAKAFELLAGRTSLSGKNFSLNADYARLEKYQKKIENFITSNISDARITHQTKKRIVGIVNVAFAGLRGGELSQILSKEERISISTGSACTSDILQPTDTIKFFEQNPDWQFPIRISLHKFLSESDVDDFCEILAHYVSALRKR
jgi:cysteine desulfurase